MSIISSLERLERVGTQSGRCTDKLRQAAFDVACEIERIVDDAGAKHVVLPRGYVVTEERSNVGSALFLVRQTGETDEWGCMEAEWIDGAGEYLHGDFHCKIPRWTRQALLQFAQDVATGLLEEIAEFLEKRAMENASAASQLSGAIA